MNKIRAISVGTDIANGADIESTDYEKNV